MQVVQFREGSTCTRQDVTVVCLCVDIATYYIFSHVRNGSKLSTGMCDVAMSCDSHAYIPNDIASIVVVLIPMYGGHWLA